MQDVYTMNILVISLDTIPAYSGGWTSNVDLLTKDHAIGFISARNSPLNQTLIEGIPVYPSEYSSAGLKKAILEVIKEYDFCLCLGDRESLVCQELHVPYMTRYHTLPFDGSLQTARQVKKDAFWTIENHPILPKDIVDMVIPHAINPDRYEACYKFHLQENLTQVNFLMLATLNWVENPTDFINACKMAKVNGTIVGDGEDRAEVELKCRFSHGYCNYLGARTHAELPEVLRNYNVGVSTLHPNSPNKYLLKSIEYAAAGLVIIQPELAKLEIPCLTYNHLSKLIDLLGNYMYDSPNIMRTIITNQYNTFLQEFNAKTWAKIFTKEVEERFHARKT